MKGTSPVLLKAVNKAASAVSIDTSDSCAARTCEQLSALLRDESTQVVVDPLIASLFPDCHPLVAQVVHSYLVTPAPTDRAMLDAWERVGREDARRSPRPRATPRASNTFTPLGLACLIRYQRGFEDEAAYLSAEAEREAARSSPPPGGGSTCQQPARPRSSRGHARRRGKRRARVR